MAVKACQPGCELEAAYLEVANRVGPSRLRQLAWVVGELHSLHALTTGGRLPDPLPSCHLWVTGEPASTYLAHAAQGRLRERKPASIVSSETGETPSTQASMRVRASCLRELAAHVTPSEDLTPPRVGGTPAREPVEALIPRRLLARLSTATTAYGVRSWLVAALASDGLRVNEIAQLRLDQIDPDHSRLRNVRTKAPGAPTEVEVDVTLSDVTQMALTDWLAMRKSLVLNDRVTHLLITLHPSHTAAGTWPAGLPISTRGLARAHRKVVTQWSQTASVAGLTPGQLKPSAGEG